MQRRRLGRTGHESSVAILGAAAFWDSTEDVVAGAFAMAVAAGVNHLDIAPQYGMAEDLAGNVLPEYRERLFVGCKTLERTASAARAQLERSLGKLRTDRFDLYQLHAVTTDDELAAALAPGGAAEALVRAREEGLVGAIGITGHFEHAPRLFLQALQQVDLDTVMLPVNPTMLALPAYRADWEALLAVVAERDLGVMAIKAVARAPWRDREHTATTWYEPQQEPDRIREAVRFTLSLPVTGFATPGDVRLLPAALTAAERFSPIGADEIEARIASADPADALVAT
jgi:aryl-alcohol dehydrogenase-like predicted oxidoreductase